MIVRGLALLPALLIAGVCHAGLFTDEEAHKKLGDLQVQNSALQEKLKSVEARLSSAENAQRSQGMGALSELESIKAELGRMRGQLEVQAHDIETTQKRQRDLYIDLDTRLRQLESAAVAPAVAPPAGDQPKLGKDKKASGKTAPAVAPAVAPPVQAAPADPVAEGKAYDAAFNLRKAGNYQGAIAAFQEFVQAYPKSPLAPGAQYWIGNSHFDLKDFKSAIASQQTLISQYPKSPKVPDAMLNIASCQQNLGDADAARKSLEELVAKYPVSDAADKAKKRLATMK